MNTVLESLLITGAVLGLAVGVMGVNYFAAPVFFEQSHRPFSNMSLVKVPILHTEFDVERMGQAAGLFFIEAIVLALFMLIHMTRDIEKDITNRKRHGE